jgi:hypothetical protein
VSATAQFGQEHASVPRPLRTMLLSWLAMIGVDLFLHAGLLAPLYDWGDAFLLRPEQAFVRIPAGYLAFLVLAAALVWLLPKLGVRRGRDGSLAAGGGGAVIWGALLLGLWSISTADPPLLIAWWLGQTAELALAGYVIGSVLAGRGLRSLGIQVGAVLVLGAASAVVLQSIGYATAPLTTPR